MTTAAPKPKIVIVPGFYEGPGSFDEVRSRLSKEHGYDTVVVSRPSTGMSSPGNTTLTDDVQIISTVIGGACIPDFSIAAIHDEKCSPPLTVEAGAALVEREHNVVLVSHSAGGFMALDGAVGHLSSDRKAKGLKGGIVQMIHVTANIMRNPEIEAKGEFPMPDWMVLDDAHTNIRDVYEHFFNDIPAAAAQPWIEKFQHEPNILQWMMPPVHGKDIFTKVPHVYLHCSQDKAIPEPIQRHFAAWGQCEVLECSAGHMVQITQPDVFVKTVHEVSQRHY